MQPLYSRPFLTAEQRRMLETLSQRLQSFEPFLIAVSGGLDSRFLAHIARENGLRFRALFFATPLVSERERAAAEENLRSANIALTAVALNPLERREVAGNELDRCYRCKHLLFATAAERAGEWGLNAVLDGTQADDLGEHRPGLAALEELSIKSPLAEAGLDKPSIRALSRALELPYPDQPSRPCLLTRYAYGRSPSPEELQRIGAAEEALRRTGLETFRIRILADARTVVQIASPPDELDAGRKEAISRILDACRLSPFRFLYTDTLSGFFDGKCRVLQSEPGHPGYDGPALWRNG